jgi:hypothetical protein
MTNAEKDWALYAAHRARFTAALLESARGVGGRLCVLGAGLCNDVDLERLAETFSEIHLVDLDAKSLARAAARQTEAVRARLHRHAPFDLSGLSPRRLARWKRVPPTVDELTVASDAALATTLARLPGPFDVVASACVLTQMSFSLRTALGARNPMLDAVRISLMGHHLNTLVGLTAAGGASLFVSDVVSSNFYPLDALPADRDRREVLRDIVDAGAAYYAANPDVVGALLGQVGAPELLEPWLWTGPLARTYFVYAYRVARPAAAAHAP